MLSQGFKTLIECTYTSCTGYLQNRLALRKYCAVIRLYVQTKYIVYYNTVNYRENQTKDI